jgi:UDP-GlcNAc:undecaprenyl-phosphate/decaprenyl-phosphate GlcNAc-1-phosphate transferase
MSFLVALGLALVLTPVARRVGLATGLVDRPSPDPLKIQVQTIPLLGGIAVVGSALAAMTLLREALSWELGAAVGVALASGMIDDAHPLPAWSRLALQGVAGALVAAGIVANAGWSPPMVLGAAAGVIALVVVCANAVNLIDGQDGLAGGLAAIAALGLTALAARNEVEGTVALGLALAGASAGFLVWNRPPARIFLGNGGAYAVGTLLAALAVTIIAEDDWRGLFAAGIAMGVFAFEFASTVIRRVSLRRPLTQGDRLHSYDLLAARAGSRTHAMMAFWILGVVSAALALIVGSVTLRVGAAATALAAAAGAACAFWLRGAGEPAPSARSE